MTSDRNRARQHFEQGQLAQAAALLDAILRSTPKDADSQLLRGQVAVAQQDPQTAVHWLRRAAKTAPHRAELQHEVGVAYLQLGLVEDALRRWESAAKTNPGLIAPQIALGRVHLDRLKQPSLAAAAFRRVLDQAPDQLDAQYHLGKALFEMGDAAQAVVELRRAREIARAARRDDVVALCGQSIAVLIPGSPAADNAAILAARSEQAPVYESEPPAATVHFARDRSPDRPLTLGYISSFFDRENWMKPVWGLLNQHDREQFPVRIFSYGPVPGGDNPGSAADSAWRPQESDRIFDVAGLTPAALSQAIADERVDLLIDLNGYSDPASMRLFAWRPAPLIVGWFNMYATTGLSCYDYVIGDRHTVRPEEEIYYSERIARVPGSYLTFRVEYLVPEVAAAPSASTGRVTFGSLCSRYKITPDVIRAWSEILRRSPGASLLLRNAGLERASERDYLISQFAGQGIAADRLKLLGRAPHFEFLETYAQIDLALDTFPYNGGTTTSEAIWQGVPVIAFDGATWAGRTSATILREGSLGDWVADDLAGYIELAVRNANDPLARQAWTALRGQMRHRLRQSSACDTPGFARAMEALYREMWQTWCRR